VAHIKYLSDRLAEQEKLSRTLVKEKESLSRELRRKDQQHADAVEEHKRMLVELDRRRRIELADQIKEIEERHALEITRKNEELAQKLLEKEEQHQLELTAEAQRFFQALREHSAGHRQLVAEKEREHAANIQNLSEAQQTELAYAARVDGGLRKHIAFLESEVRGYQEAMIYSDELRSEAEAEVKREIADREVYLDLNTVALKRKVASLQAIVDLQGEVISGGRPPHQTIEVSEDDGDWEERPGDENITPVNAQWKGKGRDMGLAAFNVSIPSPGESSQAAQQLLGEEYDAGRYYRNMHRHAHPGPSKVVDRHPLSIIVPSNEHSGYLSVGLPPGEEYHTHAPGASYHADTTYHHHIYYPPVVNGQQAFIVENENSRPEASPTQSLTNEIQQPNIRFDSERREYCVTVTPDREEGSSGYGDLPVSNHGLILEGQQ
jgi:hypothetical protein